MTECLVVAQIVADFILKVAIIQLNMNNINITQFSDYELIRLDNIHKNNQFLSGLGVNVNKTTNKLTKCANSHKKKRILNHLEPSRKSSRFVDKDPVNYKEVR